MRISDWSSDVCSSDLDRTRMRDVTRDAPSDMKLARAANGDFHRTSHSDRPRRAIRVEQREPALFVDQPHRGPGLALPCAQQVEIAWPTLDAVTVDAAPLGLDQAARPGERSLRADARLLTHAGYE